MSKLNILVSLITEDNDYQQEQAASAKEAASVLDVNLQVIYANNNAVVQTQQILDVIQEPGKRPDAVLVEPVGTGMVQVATAAVAAGVAWVIVNTNVDYIPRLRQGGRVPSFSIVSDHEQIGKIQGQQVAATLGEKGCVLYIEGPSVRDVARMRTKGMTSTKPPQVSVKTLKGDWTRLSGLRAMQSWLSLSTSKHLKVDMIAGQNDDMAMGARQAFEELADPRDRDAWLRLPITGCDGVRQAGRAWVEKGWLTATVVCPPLIGDAMRLLAKALATGAQPAERTVVAATSYPPLQRLVKVQECSS